MLVYLLSFPSSGNFWGVLTLILGVFLGVPQTGSSLLPRSVLLSLLSFPSCGNFWGFSTLILGLFFGCPTNRQPSPPLFPSPPEVRVGFSAQLPILWQVWGFFHPLVLVFFLVSLKQVAISSLSSTSSEGPCWFPCSEEPLWGFSPLNPVAFGCPWALSVLPGSGCHPAGVCTPQGDICCPPAPARAPAERRSRLLSRLY